MNKIEFGAGLGSQQRKRKLQPEDAAAPTPTPEQEQMGISSGADVSDAATADISDGTATGVSLSESQASGESPMQQVSPEASKNTEALHEAYLRKKGKVFIKPVEKEKRTLGDEQADILYGKKDTEYKGLDWIKRNSAASKPAGAQSYKRAREAVQKRKSLQDWQEKDTAAADQRFADRGNAFTDIEVDGTERRGAFQRKNGKMDRVGYSGPAEKVIAGNSNKKKRSLAGGTEAGVLQTARSF